MVLLATLSMLPQCLPSLWPSLAAMGRYTGSDSRARTGRPSRWWIGDC